VEDDRHSIPPSILSRFRNVSLCVDIMHVNGLPFLITASKRIHFGTVEALPKRKFESLIKCDQGLQAKSISREMDNGRQ
jgi:hypothetical protein